MNEITKACAAGALIGAALFGIAKQANASGVIAYTSSQNGGSIQITDEPCKGSNASGQLAIAINPAGEPIIGGCWQWIEPNIAVTWNTGDVRMYSVDGWTFTKYADGVVSGRADPKKRKSSM